MKERKRNQRVWVVFPLFALSMGSVLWSLGAEEIFADDASDFAPIRQILNKYCVRCHGDEDPQGKVDLKSIETEEEVDRHFEVWEKAISLIAEKKMPPDGEPRPTAMEVDRVNLWYRTRFIDHVVSKPGPLVPRRLTAYEYRNTIRSLFGFDLRTNVSLAEETLNETSLVMKLLPTDPRGPSGYRNDSSGNQMTAVAWDAYSQLADSAILELFSEKSKSKLESLAGPIEGGELSSQNVETFLTRFLPRAMRRDVDRNHLRRHIDRTIEDQDLESALKLELKTILLSPTFLYRSVLVPFQESGLQKLDDFEVAERLSYFLWADMPDDPLLEEARRGVLQDPEKLRSEAQRMLQSPKGRNLAEDWVVQWLLLDEIDEVSNNVPAVVALKTQAIDFFHYLIQEDRPLLEMVDSKIEFINPYTERFYPGDRKQMKRYVRPKGVEAEIVPNQRIRLEETEGRGGILMMPGILAMNRGPIIRGTWILERVLGEHLPDPPANVGQVPPNRQGEQLSFRKRFEQHRAQETCALCHDKIDPLGFAFEGYDAGGAFLLTSQASQQSGKRKGMNRPDVKSEKESEIDTSGRLPSGETFANAEELKKILAGSQRETVVRNLVRQMLSYALCRKLEYYDQPTVREITQRLKDGGTFQQLVLEIVTSLPFREAIFSSKGVSGELR